MKILHVISSMNPENGGVSQAVRNIILDNLFNNQEVVCMDDELTDYGIIDKFKIHKVGTGKTSFQYNRALIKWLFDQVQNYTHVVVHGIWQYHNFATYRALSRAKLNGFNIKIAIMPHGMLDPYFQKSESRKIKAIRNRIVWDLTERKALNAADVIMFTCEEELLLSRKTFGNYTPKAEVNVGLGVLKPPGEVPEMKTEFGGIVGKEVISYWLFLSRIHPKKGIDLLIKSYKKLSDSNPDLPYLVIAGPLDSDYASQMVALAGNQKKIKFCGMLTGDAKWGAIYGAKLFILPSHQENFGIAVVEAIACGKPVAITNKVNIYTVIRDTKSGFIFEDTLEGTNDILNRIIACSEDDLHTIAINAKKAYSVNYMPENAAKVFIKALENIR